MKTQPKGYSYIRFSSPEQMKGDSLRRQIEATERYCRENNLILDDSLNLRDLGLSAFKGTHKTRGALGQFLQLVEAGEIPKGSTLIVENLDRLSREEVLEALNQFTGIIQAGIRLVTLQDGMAYDKKSIQDNWTQLIISITYMARAHDESLRKSQRLKAAWENKRNTVTTQTGSKKLTGKTRAWLRLSEDGKHFVLIPEVCKAIEMIYRKKLAGKGVETITKELNTDPEMWKPPQTKRNKTGGWRESYISKLLWNERALIGEFQPYRLEGGKREKVGEPIPDYFPKAINEELFYSVQRLIENNRKTKGHAGGRNGKVGNLFTHIVVCGLCGGAMHFVNKGKLPKGGTYLHCDSSRRKLGCTAKAVRYDEVESMFFKDFDELDISKFIPGADESKAKINTLIKQIQVLQYRHGELERKRKNLLEQMANEDDPELRQEISDLVKGQRAEQKELIHSIEAHELELAKLKANGKTLKEGIEQAREIYCLMDSVKSEGELIEIRKRLRQQIRSICREIKIVPLTEKYQPVKEIEPGIIQTMYSRSIDRVKIYFHGAKKVRILLAKRVGEIR